MKLSFVSDVRSDMLQVVVVFKKNIVSFPLLAIKRGRVQMINNDSNQYLEVILIIDLEDNSFISSSYDYKVAVALISEQWT